MGDLTTRCRIKALVTWKLVQCSHIGIYPLCSRMITKYVYTGNNSEHLPCAHSSSSIYAHRNFKRNYDYRKYVHNNIITYIHVHTNIGVIIIALFGIVTL